MARTRFGGWSLVGWTAVILAVMVGVILAAAGTDDDGIRMVIRATARTSVVLFAPVFAASGLYRRWPGPATRWLLANRRYVGVSFAVSHVAHFLAILALNGWSIRAFFTNAGTVAGVLGSLGYVVIALMVATSFDATAAWLGARRWSRLHLAGVWYLWGIFFASFAPRTHQAPLLYGAFTALLVGALVLRLTGRAPAPVPSVA